MNNKTTSAFLLIGMIIALLHSAFVYAGSALFTVEPLTPTTLQLSAGGTAVVKYKVENISSRSHTIMMTPITGVTQNTGEGNCANPFVLGFSQSCTLALEINASQMAGNIQGGPKVCQQGPDGKPSPFLCYQPSADNSLNISVTSGTTYLYAATQDGNIYYSTDNGNDWTATTAPASGIAVNSVFATNSTLYAGMQNGYVYYSTNNGTSWTATNLPSSSNAINGVFVTAANTIYVASADGSVYYSTNNGTSWSSAGEPSGSTSVSSIFVTPNNTIYAGSANGNVYYHPNSGSWTLLSNSPALDGSAVTNIFVTTNNLIYVGTADEYVYQSNALTGGGTWALYAQTAYRLFVNADGSTIDSGTQGGYVVSLSQGSVLGFVAYSPINSVFVLSK